jgi:hypothetical protein
MSWIYSLVSDKSKFVNCWKLSTLDLQNVKTYIRNDSIYLVSGNEWVKYIHRTQCRGVLHCLCCTKHKHYTPLHSYMWSTVSSEAGDHSSAASRLRGWGSVCYCTVLGCVLAATFCICQLCYSNSMKNDPSHWLILVPFLCAFAKLSSCLPVRPSLNMEQFGSNRTDFNEIW